MLRWRPGRVPTFFLISALLRCLHAAYSTAWHIDGDMGIPWLMANDWEHTPHRRFFWGQDYLGTYETGLLARIGHWIWGADATIPVALNYLAGQLLSVAGATLVFAGLRKIRPGFGDRAWELGAAVGLLGFTVPALQKFSFSVGTGYSLTPLAVGAAVWGWACIATSEPDSPALSARFALGGLVLGLAQSEMRLNAVPLLAFAACLALNRFQQPRKWAALLLGAVLGFLPELWLGLETSGPAQLALFPIHDRFQRLGSALAQTGVAFGTLPYATTEPEDALWFRGHAPPFNHDFLDALSILLLLALLIFRRGDRKIRSTWILWGILAVDVALVTFNWAWNDLYSARRYDFPALIALSALLLLTTHWLSRALVGVRVAGLLVYLFHSVTYVSPWKGMDQVLLKADFDPSLDCVSGSGGDLSALEAINSFRIRVISHKWRLAGNDSTALDPGDLDTIHGHCRKIFHVDSGETPVSEAVEYCPKPALVYQEPAKLRYRWPLRLFSCPPFVR
jgi:hypothetical protein